MAVESEAGISRAGRRRPLRFDLTTPSLLGLPLGWLIVFFVLPIAIVGAYSVGALYISIFPGGEHPVTLTAWHEFLHSSVYLGLQSWGAILLRSDSQPPPPPELAANSDEPISSPA